MDERQGAVKEELLRLALQREGVDLFCASTRKGDPVAALFHAPGPEALSQLPGGGGDFVLNAAGVGAALPGVERPTSGGSPDTGSAVWCRPAGRGAAIRVGSHSRTVRDDGSRAGDAFVDGMP